jgi:hypothetical protein
MILSNGIFGLIAAIMTFLIIYLMIVLLEFPNIPSKIKSWWY